MATKGRRGWLAGVTAAVCIGLVGCGDDADDPEPAASDDGGTSSGGSGGGDASAGAGGTQTGGSGGGEPSSGGSSGQAASGGSDAGTGGSGGAEPGDAGFDAAGGGAEDSGSNDARADGGSPSEAGGIPEGCLLAFQPSNDAIALVTSDGSTEAPVIQESGRIDELAWSPDGRQIAYTVRPNFDLVTVDADGSNRTVLTTGARQLDWSPDGTQIAFGDVGQIFTIRADGSARTQLTDAVGSQWPRWSPDGEKLAFDRSDAIFVIDSDGENETPLGTGSMTHPAWSPSGDRIAAANDGTGLFVFDPDGGNAVGPIGKVPRNGELDWSPDGGLLLFTNQPTVATVTGLSVIAPDGTGETVVVQPVGAVPAFDPAWSPGGTRIAYATSAPGNNNGVHVADADGDNEKRIADGTGPRWSPLCEE